MRKWIVVLVAIGLLLLFFFNFYTFLKKRVLTSEFKLRTEERLGELLRAHVKIGKIRFGLLKHVSLSGLEIDHEKSTLPVQIGVDKITIKYNLLDFLKQKFKVPAEVFLDSPIINFKSLVSPFSVLDLFGLKPRAGIFKRVELANGELDFLLSGFSETLYVKKIQGKAIFNSEGILNVLFTGQTSGIASGSVRVEGSLKPGAKSGSLDFRFEDVDFLPPSRLPITELNGNVQVSDSKIVLSNIRFKLRGLPIDLSGSVERPFTPNPKWNFSGHAAKGNKLVGFNVSGDLKDESIAGAVDLFGSSFPFNGNVSYDQTGFQLSHLKFENGYEGYGAFRLHDRRYEFKAENGKQRFSLDLNLINLDVDLDFNLSHLQLANHDVTAFGKVRLSPVGAHWDAGDYRMKGYLKTGYLIFDFHPLNDFQADFEIAEFGVNPLIAKWGTSSNLKGSLAFGDSPSLDSTILINGFKLQELKFLGLHPMPLSFEGTLEGKIRLVGKMEKPDVSGRLMIHNGKIGDFKYDEAILEFYGAPPYLRLLDSKIIRKDNTFLIKGDVDFQLENIFQKIKVVSLDQIVIWKGLDIASEIETRAKSRIIDFERIDALAPITAARSGANAAKVEAEYTLKGGKSLTLTAEEHENGQVVTAGPKWRF